MTEAAVRSWTVDGIADASEYYGALSLPYRNAAEAVSHGQALVNVAEREETFEIHVFLDDLPVMIDAVEVAVYLDFLRFGSDDEGVKGEDRAYVVDVDSGAQELWVGAGRAWAPDEPTLPWQVVVGGCTPTTRIPYHRLCDVEYSIVLDELEADAIGARNAFGFAAGDRGYEGGTPPQMARHSGDASVDRTEYQTLLITEPAGVPFQLISWNMKRFSGFMQTVLGDDFGDVSLAEQAKLLYRFDVIAVQELWEKDDALGLLGKMNAIRDMEGLPPLMMHGPVQFAPNLLEQVVDAADELHGGLWIFSSFPAIDGGYDVFDACIGEDCLKSKGVQWVRLALDAPGEVPPECIPTYVSGGGYQPLPPADCPRPATSEMFIDVFNTHLQAKPTICGDPAVLAYLHDVFTGGFLTALGEASFHCFSTSKEAVQEAQLDEIRGFMKAVLQDNPSRQALLVGDFNIDGQALNYGAGSDRYGDMVERLGVLSPGSSSTADEPAVWVHPHADSYGWDIDMGDLAREEPSSVCTWDPAGSVSGCEPWADPGTGTSIGVRSAAACTDPDETCRDNDAVPDGKARIDYVFVVPGQWDRLDYVLARTSGADVYGSPWPELGDPATLTYDGPPARLSDHKPVVANLTLVSLRESPPFYPDVPHQFRFTVRSVDATGEHDCFLGACNPLDMMSKMVGRVDDGSGAVDLPGTPFWSSECEGWNLSRVADACMADWEVTDVHDPSTDFEHQGGAMLFESDSTSPTDEYPTTSPTGHPLLRMRWSLGRIEARELDTMVPLDNWEDVTILHNDPVEWCTKDRPVRMCVEVRFDELAP